ncbi:MAG: hypothetical protein AAF732_19570 [Pseudomonadota bacterium]
MKKIVTLLAGVVVGFGLTAPPSYAAEPGDQFVCSKVKGRWTGFGWFNFVHQPRERARCIFNVGCPSGPSSGAIQLKCASTGTEIDAVASFVIADGRANGKWKISNYGVSGTVAGKASIRDIDVFMRVGTPEYSAFGAALKIKMKEGLCKAAADVDLQTPLGLKGINLAVRRC